jgi:small subunit ribosomal protein S2
MASYIYGSRNKIHIIDLTQSVPLLHQALVTVSDVVSKGGRVLFVGTKRQASEAIADAARSCAQYYINHRWLGGTLTNWRTISNSIKRLKHLEELLAGETHGLTPIVIPTASPIPFPVMTTPDGPSRFIAI